MADVSSLSRRTRIRYFPVIPMVMIVVAIAGSVFLLSRPEETSAPVTWGVASESAVADRVIVLDGSGSTLLPQGPDSSMGGSSSTVAEGSVSTMPSDSTAPTDGDPGNPDGTTTPDATDGVAVGVVDIDGLDEFDDSETPDEWSAEITEAATSAVFDWQARAVELPFEFGVANFDFTGVPPSWDVRSVVTDASTAAGETVTVSSFALSSPLVAEATSPAVALFKGFDLVSVKVPFAAVFESTSASAATVSTEVSGVLTLRPVPRDPSLPADVELQTVFAVVDVDVSSPAGQMVSRSS